MTRFIHDQFSKDFIESLLTPYGAIKVPSRVAAEVKMIDILFTPRVLQNPELEPLGLLGKFAEFPAIIEPFRNPVPEDDISDCIIKVWEVQKSLQRHKLAKQNCSFTNSNTKAMDSYTNDIR
ncbi:hypothetical protein NIES4071_47320 [Calothrix sp. NIES-4071]|nr:hypothetical protein NIES4071_47320 [Calothrix sp. NIES-4071]BAZ59043.1 hypothetical protein NIES4105_47250 [Calothrix sp. NIES-4105]